MTAAELKRVRLALGLGPVAMARRLNVPYASYWRWEAAKNKVPPLVAMVLAAKPLGPQEEPRR